MSLLSDSAAGGIRQENMCTVTLLLLRLYPSPRVPRQLLLHVVQRAVICPAVAVEVFPSLLAIKVGFAQSVVAPEQVHTKSTRISCLYDL